MGKKISRIPRSPADREEKKMQVRREKDDHMETSQNKDKRQQTHGFWVLVMLNAHSCLPHMEKGVSVIEHWYQGSFGINPILNPIYI